MKAVAALHGTKTVIMVAHRTSTLKQCDRLYQLEAGRLTKIIQPDDLSRTRKGIRVITDFTFETHTIGIGKPTFIIAEAGVNHNGDEKVAAQLVREAKNAGADCVKFQTFKAERVVTNNAPKANYQLSVTDPQQSQLEMLRRIEPGRTFLW